MEVNVEVNVEVNGSKRGSKMEVIWKKRWTLLTGK